MKINLKKIIKKNPFLLAPMDNVTDISFRKLCEIKGAGYTTSELSNVEAIIRDKTLKSRYQKCDLNINAVQLFGNKPEIFVKALNKINLEADIIDVNFGCPSSNLINNNSGAALLKDPKNVGKIIEKLVKNTNKPISAKIRLGYKNTSYLEIAKEVEDAGAQLITIHGRTAKQKYSGKANWEPIKEIYLKSNNIVIGNGDISEEKDISKYLNSYCDGFMIGRSAIGNPLIFEKFNYYLKNNKKMELNIDEIKEKQKKLFLEYVKNLQKHEFNNINLKIQRQAMWFFKGIIGIKDLRRELSKTTQIENILKIIKKF